MSGRFLGRRAGWLLGVGRRWILTLAGRRGRESRENRPRTIRRWGRRLLRKNLGPEGRGYSGRAEPRSKSHYFSSLVLSATCGSAGFETEDDGWLDGVIIKTMSSYSVYSSKRSRRPMIPIQNTWDPLS